MKYQRVEDVVLREDGFSGRKAEKHNPAAMVFEETAGATLELAHLEPHRAIL